MEFEKDKDGWVKLSGEVPVQPGHIAFQIPEGYRPMIHMPEVKKHEPGWRERLKLAVHCFFYRLRIDLCFDEEDGYNLGCFCFTWKRARGPFMLHRQYANESAYAADDCDECGGPWRLMVAFTPAAYRGFDESILK